MGQRVCLFCGSDGKLTSAHLISRSLQKLLPTNAFGTSRADIWADEQSLVPNFRHSQIDIHPANHQVKRLCHACNGVWMAGLEDVTRSTLADLFHGRPVGIVPSAQDTLSTWATVVCMLRSTQDPGMPAVSPEDLAFVRDQSAPPPGYQVWLVAGEDTRDVSMRHYRASIDDTAGWLGWIWLGASILVVSSNTLAPVSEPRLALLPAAAAKIHPSTHSVAWPPRNHVLHNSFFDLMTLHD